MFDDNCAKIAKTLSGGQVKVTASSVELLAAVNGLESARDRANNNVKIHTTSRILHDILTKWLVIWKKNKWKKGNGSRLTIPTTLLKRLDILLKVDKHCPQKVKHFSTFVLLAGDECQCGSYWPWKLPRDCDGRNYCKTDVC